MKFPARVAGGNCGWLAVAKARAADFGWLHSILAGMCRYFCWRYLPKGTVSTSRRRNAMRYDRSWRGLPKNTDEGCVNMSNAGSRLLRSARNARAFVRGETTEGFVVHVPDAVDVRAIRAALGLSQA